MEHTYKTIYFSPRWKIRRISLIFRSKTDYQKPAIGLWWDLHIGEKVIGKPHRKFKYLMLGLYLINWVCWMDIKYVSKSKIK